MDSLLISDSIKLDRAFRAKNHFDFTFGKYRLYVADQRVDLYKALQLRSRVFYNNEKLDIDDFDFLADHILIEHQDSHEVIGTYRMLSDLFCTTFYSQTEFQIDGFLQEPGRKIELGRACISPEYRNGRSIDLLWRGIATYLTYINADYLFGCSSLFLNQENADLTISHIKAVAKDNPHRIQAWNPYPAAVVESELAQVPPLLQSYLRAGAKVIGDPAWDKEMNCVDFFTYLKIDDLSAKYRKHYF